MSEEAEHTGTINPVVALVVLGACSAFSVALYLPFLTAFFLLDDLPLLARYSAMRGAGLSSALLPMPNGFWRPLGNGTVWVLSALCGERPFVLHLPGVLLHGLVAFLVFCAARIVLGLSAIWAGFAALLLLIHPGAFAAVAQMANLPDVFLGVAMLAGWIAWDRWLHTRRAGWLFGVAAGALLSLASKETAVVLPLCWVLWAFAVGRLDRGTARVLLPVGIVCAAQVIAILWLQKTSTLSYTSESRTVWLPLHVLRQFADYGASMAIPYLHTMEWPVRHLALSHGALWLIRGLVLATAGMALWGAARGARGAALLLMALMVVVPVSVLSGAPQGRFLYAALPFACLAIAMVMRGLRPRLALSLAAVFMVLYLPGVRLSPTSVHYRETASRVEAFVEEARLESAHWAPGQTISVQHHPHPGEAPFRWVYCQLLFDLFVEVPVIVELLDDDFASPPRWPRSETAALLAR